MNILSLALSLSLYIYMRGGWLDYICMYTHTHTHTHIHQSAEEEKDVPTAGEEDGSSLVSKSARSINRYTPISVHIGTYRYISVHIDYFFRSQFEKDALDENGGKRLSTFDIPRGRLWAHGRSYGTRHFLGVYIIYVCIYIHI